MKEKHFMKKYSRENLKDIQAIVQEKTGAAIVPDRKPAGYKIRKMAFLAGSLLCLVSLSVFAYAKFSGLKTLHMQKHIILQNTTGCQSKAPSA